MRFSVLMNQIPRAERAGGIDPEITGVTHDSRLVGAGWLFVAVSGDNVDGTEFIAQALEKGAVAVVSEASLDLGAGVASARVPDARRALAEIANAFHGDLSREMRVFGVTGTNGKTTTAYLIRDVLRDAGANPGLLGTVAYEIGDRAIPATRTTPEATDIHALFQTMREADCASVVMEVSSHAIDLERVRGIDFKVAVFTNLTRDHLDYHQDMETYYGVKARLFRELGAERAAVINIDDPWGSRLAEEPLAADVVTYGFDERASVRASDAVFEADGTTFKVESPWGEATARLRLLGRFNAHNALAAIAAGGVMGCDLNGMVGTLANIAAIPGRLEPVANRKRLRVFVDYAHTDDALKNVLETLREICRGRLIVVFGCGGNRDRGKRAKMGAVAAELADYSIITSDNPRDEEPGLIAGEVLAGFDAASNVEVVLDRRAAIEKGIGMTRRKDVLLIAGKGHETYQEVKGAVVPFDDRETAREVMGS